MDSSNFAALRESLTVPIIRKASLKKNPSENTDEDATELSDFIQYLTSELWTHLPPPLQVATYNALLETPSLTDLSNFPFASIPLSFSESLINYNIVTDDDDVQKLLVVVLEDYVDAVCAPPPVWVGTRGEECEICERNVPLSYHHLIPKSTHTKVLKRKWHPKHMLNSVAWLCRACHSAVHKSAPNETLAKEFYTIELLLEREDILRWRGYIAKQRWGGRACKKR